MSPKDIKQAVFLKLQQVVLDCEDNSLLMDVLFRETFSELGETGIPYIFISAIFLDLNLKLSKSSFYDKQTLIRPDEYNQQSEAILPQHIIEDGVQVQLEGNKIVVSEDIKRFIDPIYKDFALIKAVVLSPVFVSGHLAGVIVLACPRLQAEITEDELAFLEVFTNLLAFTYRLQATQKSLSAITQEVYKMNAKLHYVDKLKDDFVSVASHELRTPMTAIKSFLWMALNRQKENLNPDLKRYLDRAYLSTERLISLVNDMLNISRIEGGRIALRLSDVDLVDLGLEVYEELVPKAQERGIKLTVSKGEVQKVLCDRDKVREVFINIVGNSLKFTEKGGTIGINFKQEGDTVITSISDTGRGIAHEDMQRLFKKFGRLENSYVAIAESAGTGLGLFITKSLIALHKGRVWAESPGLGKGSTFFFSLPIVGTELARQVEANAPTENANTKELEKTRLLM
ncbi:MAG TPA: GAF domain-containing sensor histidine kinase [Candidatus Saccharimonadales bacterium]|nr:GAF domain-containing sensor histidine kinase [Candidatus Saccharimonadales bacterium]